MSESWIPDAVIVPHRRRIRHPAVVSRVIRTVTARWPGAERNTRATSRPAKGLTGRRRNKILLRL